MTGTGFWCDEFDRVVIDGEGWRFCPLCGAAIGAPHSGLGQLQFVKRPLEEVKTMSELETIAGELESKAARLRSIAGEYAADAAKVEADLSDFGNTAAGGTSTTLPADPTVPVVDPATAATPVEPAQGEPQPATATNVHASDGPLASEQAAAAADETAA